MKNTHATKETDKYRMLSRAKDNEKAPVRYD
jgi:hypothetical protein